MSCHCAISLDITALVFRYILWPYCPVISLYPVTLLSCQFAISFDPIVLSLRYNLGPYCLGISLYPLTILTSQFAIPCNPIVLSVRYTLWPYGPVTALYPWTLLPWYFAISFDPTDLSVRYILWPYCPVSSLWRLILLSSQITTATHLVLTATRVSLLSAVPPYIHVLIYAAKTWTDTPLFCPNWILQVSRVTWENAFIRRPFKIVSTWKPSSDYEPTRCVKEHTAPMHQNCQQALSKLIPLSLFQPA